MPRTTSGVTVPCPVLEAGGAAGSSVNATASAGPPGGAIPGKAVGANQVVRRPVCWGQRRRFNRNAADGQPAGRENHSASSTEDRMRRATRHSRASRSNTRTFSMRCSSRTLIKFPALSACSTITLRHDRDVCKPARRNCRLSLIAGYAIPAVATGPARRPANSHLNPRALRCQASRANASFSPSSPLKTRTIRS
jgi:hypothetical protein